MSKPSIEMSATELLVSTMEKLQDAENVRVVILLDGHGPSENLISLNANVDIVQILGMLKYGMLMEEQIVKEAGEE